MGHYNELSFARKLFENAHKAANIGVVERGIYFVENTEGTGFDEVNGKEQRDRCQRALATRKQGNALELFTARSGRDINTRF